MNPSSSKSTPSRPAPARPRVSDATPTQGTRAAPGEYSVSNVFPTLEAFPPMEAFRTWPLFNNSQAMQLRSSYFVVLSLNCPAGFPASMYSPTEGRFPAVLNVPYHGHNNNAGQPQVIVLYGYVIVPLMDIVSAHIPLVPRDLGPPQQNQVRPTRMFQETRRSRFRRLIARQEDSQTTRPRLDAVTAGQGGLQQCGGAEGNSQEPILGQQSNENASGRSKKKSAKTYYKMREHRRKQKAEKDKEDTKHDCPGTSKNDRPGSKKNDSPGPKKHDSPGPKKNDRSGPKKNDRSGPKKNDRSGPKKNDRSGPKKNEN